MTTRLMLRGGPMPRIGAAALGALLLGVVVVTATATGRPQRIGVEVTSLEVAPLIVRAGDPITITATIQNLSARPITAFTIGAAVTHGVSSIEIATDDDTRPTTLAVLPRGAEVSVRTQVRLTGYGWAHVGIGAIGDGTLVAPVGRRVLVVEPIPIAIEGVLLVLSLVVIVSLFVALWGACARAVRGAAPVGRPKARHISLGVAMLLGAYLVWLMVPASVRAGAPGAVAVLTFAGLAAFILGWLVIGAALRVGNSAPLGSLAAAALYALIGLVWAFALTMGLGRLPSQTLRPALLWEVASWPFELAQVALGLQFGLGP